MDLNKVQLIWRITQDIELKQTPNWLNVTTFSLATNRNFTDGSWTRQEQTEFHTIVLWGKLAEEIGKLKTEQKGIKLKSFEKIL